MVNIAQASIANQSHPDKAVLIKYFNDADTNHDNVLTTGEVRNVSDAKASEVLRGTFSLQVKGRGYDSKPASMQLWEYMQATGNLYKERIFSNDDMKDVLLVNVSRFGTLIVDAPDFLKNDWDVALAALTKFEDAYEHIGNDLKYNNGFLLKAISNNYKVFAKLPDFQKSDRLFVIDAIKEDGMALTLSEKFKNDPKLREMAVKQNFNAAKYLINTPANLKAKYKNISSQLADLGISTPERFDTKTAKEIIRNRDKVANPEGGGVILKDDLIKLCESPEDVDKLWNELVENKYLIVNDKGEYAANSEKLNAISEPSEQMELSALFSDKKSAVYHTLKKDVALFIYPTKDSNQGFTRLSIRALMNEGYTVIYYNASCDTDLYADVIEAGQYIKKTSSNSSPSSINIGGHGIDFEDGSFKLSFGYEEDYMNTVEDNKNKANETLFLDWSDTDEMEASSLERYIGKSVITLDMCYSAKDGVNGGNIANMMKQIFPNSTVYAMKERSLIREHIFDKNGNIIGLANPLYMKF